MKRKVDTKFVQGSRGMNEGDPYLLMNLDTMGILELGEFSIRFFRVNPQNVIVLSMPGPITGRDPSIPSKDHYDCVGDGPVLLCQGTASLRLVVGVFRSCHVAVVTAVCCLILHGAIEAGTSRVWSDKPHSVKCLAGS